MSEPHTSETALQDAFVYMSTTVQPYTKNLNAKLKVFKPSLSNSTLMDLLTMRLWTMTDKGRLLTDGTVLSNHTQ